MALFSFGKKRRVHRKKSGKGRKPPAALLKKCRKHHIKTTMKKGGKRVYRKVSTLKKLLARKMRKMGRKVHRKSSFGRRRRSSRFGESLEQVKTRLGDAMFKMNPITCPDKYSLNTFQGNNSTYGICSDGSKVPKYSPPLIGKGTFKDSLKFGRRRRSTRRSRFGNGGVVGFQFDNPANYGFDQKVQQYPSVLSQSNTVVNEQMNLSRPEGMVLSSSDLPVYGVYRNFFGQDVPTQIPPNWDCMGQPDGTCMPVGVPFQSYKTPVSFGKKKRSRRYNVSGSGCNGLRKRVCMSNPNCSYTKRGCRRRKGTATKGVVYEGPSLQFGRRRPRRRYNVPGSPCNKLRKRVCRSNPNCSYTKRGCRRRKGTRKGLMYEGPSLMFGKKKRSRRYNVPGSSCNKLRKRVCKSNPNCSYTKRGCRRRKGTRGGLVYEGPSLFNGEYVAPSAADVAAAEAAELMFGRRRRRGVRRV
uniref:Uncharacterized protein n=1 Tax=viral metagenome TaxID=1070528 RepID=A0A6C0AY84_9ZZZZ